MTTGDDYYHQAVRLYEQEKYTEVVDLLWEALEELSDEGRLWQLYGTACYNLGELPAARDALETAMLLVPLHPVAQLALARIHVQADERELAVTIYQHLIESEVCPTSLLPRVAVDLNALGEYELALAACQTITDRNPAHHQAHFGTAFYLARLGAPPEELIPPLALAHDLAPTMLQYRLNLAFALADAGRMREARDLLRDLDLGQVGCRCVRKRIRNICKPVEDSE